MAGTMARKVRCSTMQYVIYFAVTTPLVLAGLLWASATTPPQPPMFNTGYNAVYAEAPAVAGAKPVGKAIADNSSKAANKASDKHG
jgi:hypothetical protein